jgi:hypothetical protein
MGQSQSIVDYIIVAKSHLLSNDCFKLIKVVLPHMEVIFRKSKWVLEGVKTDELDYQIKSVAMLSISKTIKCESNRGEVKCRLEFDFLKRKVKYLTFRVDCNSKHQLVKKMAIVNKIKVRCPQKKHTLNLLEDAILNNHY